MVWTVATGQNQDDSENHCCEGTHVHRLKLLAGHPAVKAGKVPTGSAFFWSGLLVFGRLLQARWTGPLRRRERGVLSVRLLDLGGLLPRQLRVLERSLGEHGLRQAGKTLGGSQLAFDVDQVVGDASPG